VTVLPGVLAVQNAVMDTCQDTIPACPLFLSLPVRRENER